jgi:ribosome-associated translation inhibitor RaiA
MSHLPSPPAADVAVETRGEVSLAAPDYARTKLLALLERVEEPVLSVRVKLTQEANHAVGKPSLAQATVELRGRPVRAHVAAATMREAVDLLQHRLRTRIERVRHHQDHDRHATTAAQSGSQSWGHAHEHRPARLPRDAEERSVVRHKSYSLMRQTPWAAVFELEAMDYDFHLFTDATTERDSVVHRLPEHGGYGLLCSGAAPESLLGLKVSPLAAPELTAHQAIDRLDLSGQPFVFFTDAATGRGNLLYHRYDGHYGLITPAQE